MISSGTNNNLFSVYFTGANSAVAAGTGIILKTTNAGLNWQNQNISVNSDLYSVCFSDENNGTAVGQLGIILRNNKWRNWNKANFIRSAPKIYIISKLSESIQSGNKN